MTVSPNSTSNKHIPVLLKEVVASITHNTTQALKVFDGTLGGGGYTADFLARGHEVWAGDLDPQAIENFWIFHPELEADTLVQNLHLQQANFAHYITQFEDNFFDGIVLDLGFSSNQLEVFGRGFSYQNLDEPFDLRFDNTTGKSASQLLQYAQNIQEINKAIFHYSGEDLSNRIATELFTLAQTQPRHEPFTVEQIATAVTKVIPGKFWHKRNGILSRVWQAFRIWTNQEFESLEQFLPVAINKLKPGGKLSIVCFHSLEDKIVTKFMRTVAKPREIDEYGNKEADFAVVTSKAIVPAEEEVAGNPRSRSATLRVLEKLR